MMLALLDDLETSHAGRAKALLYRDIARGDRATRKRLAQRLGMRPATVSGLIGEMIDDGLVVEGRPEGAARKGRPEIPLRAAPARLVALVLRVVSRDIRGVLVDLAGRPVAEHTVPLDRRSAENAAILAAFEAAAKPLLASVPAGSGACGVAVSVPGLVDAAHGRWAYSSRWPRMRDITFDALATTLGWPIRVDRNLNVELRARLLRRPEERDGSVLFVHWGYGVGSSFADNGRIVTSRLGGFAEFGHWTVAPGSDRRCRCGQTGCLEAEAGLWALLPELRASHGAVPSDELAFEQFLARPGIAELPAIARATEAMAGALRNLYLAFFADRIVLTGPFSRHPAIMARLDASFRRHLPDFVTAPVPLRTARAGADDEIVGSALPLLQAGLLPLLEPSSRQRRNHGARKVAAAS